MTTPLMVRMSLYIKCGGDGTDLRDARGLGSALGSFSLPRGANSKPGKLCHVAPQGRDCWDVDQVCERHWQTVNEDAVVPSSFHGLYVRNLGVLHH